MWAFSGLVDNQDITLALTIGSLLFMFYALGRITQAFLRFNRSNTFISIPIGFFVYLLVNQVFFSPIILLFSENATINTTTLLKIFDILKTIVLLFFIFIYYDAWLPKFSYRGSKKIIVATVSVTFVVLLYAFMAMLFESFCTVDLTWVDSINSIEYGSYQPPIVPLDIDARAEGGLSLYSIVNKFKSFYYWIYLQANFQNADTSYIVNFEVGIIIVSILTLTILSSVVNTENSMLSYIVATGISVLITLLLGFYVPPTTDLFYSTIISIIITLLFYDYTRKALPSESTITIIFIINTAFITAGLNSMTLLLVYGFLCVTISSLRGGKIIQNLVNYLSLITFLMVMYFSSTIVDLSNAGAAITHGFLYIILGGLLILFILLPLYSLANTSSRRGELVSFEKSIKTNLNRIFIGATIACTLFALAFNFLFLEQTTIQLVKNFFAEISPNESKWTIGLIIYLIFIVIPTVTIFVLWRFNIKSTLLSMFAFMNLLLNPFFVSTICQLMNINFESEVLLMPSLLIIATFILQQTTRRVPQLH